MQTVLCYRLMAMKSTNVLLQDHCACMSTSPIYRAKRAVHALQIKQPVGNLQLLYTLSVMITQSKVRSSLMSADAGTSNTTSANDPASS